MEKLQPNQGFVERTNLFEDCDVQDEDFPHYKSLINNQSKYNTFSGMVASKNKFCNDFPRPCLTAAKLKTPKRTILMAKSASTEPNMSIIQRLKDNPVFSKIYNQHSRNQTSLEQITQDTRQIDEMYEIEEKIKDRAFGIVYKAVQKSNNTLRAIFILRKAGLTQVNFKRFMNEVCILSRLNHPNIIKLLDFVEDEHFYYMITQYPEGGSLYSYINESLYDEEMIKIIMGQLLSAIDYLHKNGVVVGNLRMDNIMLQKSKTKSQITLKIVDFDSAIEQKGNPLPPLQISSQLMYMAPEATKQIGNSKSDIWSLGIIFYLMLTKKVPYEFKDQQMLTRQVLVGNYSKKWLARVPLEIKIFLRSLLEVDWTKRTTAEDALKCKWLDLCRKKTVIPPKQHEQRQTIQEKVVI